MADPLELAVTEVVSALGFELVEMRQAGSTQRPILQVRIDHPVVDLPGAAVHGQSVTSNDCARASRALEEALEGRGLVGTQYTLEVSSPGDDRPLNTARDWRRCIGQRVKIKHHAIQGSAYGFIEEVDDISAQRTLVMVRREDGEETMSLDLAQMREAHLAPDLKPKPKPGKAPKAPKASKAKK